MASTVWWLRKGLRLHDNPALLAALEGATAVHPLFVLDPVFLKPQKVGAPRLRFLLEALADLDAALRARNSRLIVLHGSPAEVLPEALRAWGATRLCFEWDSEEYALARDAQATRDAQALGCTVVTPVSNTLYDPRAVIAAYGGRPPLTYTAFCKVIEKLPTSSPVADPPASFPPPLADAEARVGRPHGIPTLAALGYPPLGADDAVLFKGGETAGLARLEAHMAREDWVCKFEKPETSPTQLIGPLVASAPAATNPFDAAKKAAAARDAKGKAAEAGGADALLSPSTTALSPYLKFGCVSSRLFAAKLRAVYAAAKGKHSAPPVSLLGQLLWRDFYYTAALGTPNFGKMVGNPICRQVPWAADAQLLAAWEEGRTGYPWIDAAMTQLRQQGWLHHLARHAVACFLTRGDLWQSWERGAEVFDRLLLDADPALNNGNWMWLSASAFFHQFFRVYSPVAFPKKCDPRGAYVRHFLPVLCKMPDKYIYEPWLAPLDVQRAAGCVIGVDYPAPVVDHAEASKANIAKMTAAYAANRAAGAAGGDGDDEAPKAKKAKAK